MTGWCAVIALFFLSVAIELFLFAVSGMSVHELVRRGTSNRRRLAAAGSAIVALATGIAIGKHAVLLMASTALGGQ